MDSYHGGGYHQVGQHKRSEDDHHGGEVERQVEQRQFEIRQRLL